MTATLNGSAFTASTAAATGSSAVPGSVSIASTVVSGSTTTTVTLLLGFIPGTGTFPLGVNQSTTPGGSLTVLVSAPGSSSNYLTPFSGAAGSVTITTLTSSQIAGTFSGTAPGTAPTSGSESVTSGSFNVPLTGFTAAPSTNPGSTFTATLGGTAFVGGTVIGTSPGGALTISATTTSAAGVLTSITLIGGQAGTGKFPFFSTTQSPITVNVVIGSTTYGGTSSDAGTVTITNVSNGYVTGTFSGTLSQSAFPVSGTFNVKF